MLNICPHCTEYQYELWWDGVAGAMIPSNRIAKNLQNTSPFQYHYVDTCNFLIFQQISLLFISTNVRMKIENYLLMLNK